VDDRHPVGSHPARTRWVESRLGVARDPVDDLLVAVHRRARRELAGVEAVESLLREDPARAAYGLDPLSAILLRREVVEPQSRMRARVARRDLERSAYV